MFVANRRIVIVVKIRIIIVLEWLIGSGSAFPFRFPRTCFIRYLHLIRQRVEARVLGENPIQLLFHFVVLGCNGCVIVSVAAFCLRSWGSFRRLFTLDFHFIGYLQGMENSM